MTRKRHTPVVSFGTRLMAVMLKAALGPITKTMPWNDATRLRQRAYMLRMAMFHEKHPQYDAVSRVRITIDLGDLSKKQVGTTWVPQNPRAPVTITFSPNDSEFDDMFSDVDITAPSAPPSDTTNTTVPDDDTTPRSSTDILEDLLKDI